MRCVVHLRRSFSVGGQHYVLRVYPQFQWEERRSESFVSSEALVERLALLGVPRMDPKKSFPRVGGTLDAVWTNVEIPDETLEGFGKSGTWSPGGAKTIAA
jgi:hypothetical protein